MTGERRLSDMPLVSFLWKLSPRAWSALALLAVMAVAAPARADLKVGDRMKELDNAVDASDKPFKLKSISGWKFVSANAAWCEPCKKELPQWDKLQAALGSKITLVALSLDNDVKDGKAFHKKLKLSHMKLVYMPEEKSAVAASYGASTMPASFVIDPDGVVKYVHKGFDPRNADGEYKKMKERLEKLLK
ncbi:MAG TPA: TlpA disulfide reductase family protein [Kofleriaceae bacterium]|nr:TlpA disulfide reductase family protein [Kofleriaceae bacterium]